MSLEEAKRIVREYEAAVYGSADILYPGVGYRPSVYRPDTRAQVERDAHLARAAGPVPDTVLEAETLIYQHQHAARLYRPL